ncbi:MAG: DUF1289 domain-containing protein [Leptothrix sp. (in: b-proteobacteria)]
MSPNAPVGPAGAPVPSPCVKRCELDAAQQRCTGCWRDIDEIVRWARLDEAHQRRIWAELPLRRAAAASAAD